MELIKKGTRILCLSPHPDDVEFGLGATLNKFKGVIEGILIVFSDRSNTRGEKYNERDQQASSKIAGFSKENVKFIDQLGLDIDRLPIRFFASEENRDRIRTVISKTVEEFKPDIIFCPSIKETMQDHQAIGEEVIRICRDKASILGYEVPKHNRFFQPNVFVNISEDNLNEKIKMLECFSEFTKRYYFKEDSIKSLARIRALDAGYYGFAEGFELYRAFIP